MRSSWLTWLAAGLWLLPGRAQAAAKTELYQVTGDTFSTSRPPPAPSFRYGPFDGLSPEQRFARICARWSARLTEKHVPGGSLAVVLDGRLALSAGVGVLRAGSTARVRSDSVFRVASLSKLLLAATLLTLVERDELSLSEPLVHAVPYFKRAAGYDAAGIDLEMLLTHTSGIPDIDGIPHPFGLRSTLEVHAEDPLYGPPGRLFNYSNAGYAWLAAVISEKLARPFGDVVVERVLQPSGMSNAGYSASPASLGNLSAGHDARGRAIWLRPNDGETSRAAGGVLASVDDFAHFVEVLLAGGRGVLSEESVAALMTGHVRIQRGEARSYGYGLWETSYAGLRVLEHSGVAAGFSTFVRIVPARNFAAVAFDNGAADPSDAVDAATSAFLELPEDAGQRRAVTAPETWQTYAGKYVDTAGGLGRFEITLEGDHLFFTSLAAASQKSLPNALRGTFVADAHSGTLYFVSRFGVARRE